METPDFCPVSNTLKIIGKKWTINIINDLLFGKTRFTEFLDSKPGLTPKVLSERLKSLEEHSIIEKKVTSVTPIKIEYSLTNKGKHLNRINFEIAMFSAIHEPEMVFINLETSLQEVIESFGKLYHFSKEEIQLYHKMFLHNSYYKISKPLHA